jgi:hypothetical protein
MAESLGRRTLFYQMVSIWARRRPDNAGAGMCACGVVPAKVWCIQALADMHMRVKFSQSNAEAAR